MLKELSEVLAVPVSELTWGGAVAAVATYKDQWERIMDRALQKFQQLRGQAEGKEWLADDELKRFVHWLFRSFRNEDGTAFSDQQFTDHTSRLLETVAPRAAFSDFGKYFGVEQQQAEDPLDSALAANVERETLIEQVHGAPLVVEAPAAAEEEPVESGVPAGCTDYKVQGGKLMPSDQEENWRCSGSTVVKFGFELTQDKDNQEGHLLCRVPFQCRSNEIHASLEYVMEPKSAAEGGGQGLCVYLVDPSVPGWDRHFDGSGPMGFVGKKGAILGVGIDMTGEFGEGLTGSRCLVCVCFTLSAVLILSTTACLSVASRLLCHSI